MLWRKLQHGPKPSVAIVVRCVIDLCGEVGGAHLWSSCRDPPVKTTGNVGLHSQAKVLCFLDIPFLRETDDPGDVCRDFM